MLSLFCLLVCCFNVFSKADTSFEVNQCWALTMRLILVIDDEKQKSFHNQQVVILNLTLSQLWLREREADTTTIVHTCVKAKWNRSLGWLQMKRWTATVLIHTMGLPHQYCWWHWSETGWETHTDTQCNIYFIDSCGALFNCKGKRMTNGLLHPVIDTYDITQRKKHHNNAACTNTHTHTLYYIKPHVVDLLDVGKFKQKSTRLINQKKKKSSWSSHINILKVYRCAVDVAITKQL